MRKGKYVTNEVQAAEKVYQDLRLEVRNSGGHSSLPVKDNAIYRLSAGLSRLAVFEFPPQLNDITRAYFTRAAPAQIDAQTQGRHAGSGQGADGRRRRGAALRAVTLFQLAAAHDLRGHAARWRTRAERAAAAGHRERELPHPAGRAGQRRGHRS